MENNRLKVRSGIWIKGANGTDSRKGHPDYFMRIPNYDGVTRTSFNQAIEAEIVDAIVRGDQIR